MLSSQLFWRVFAVVVTLALSAVLAATLLSPWLALGLTAGLALLATAVVVGHIIGPLEALTRAAQQIADGASPDEVPVQSHNEIGRLATAFNSMSQQLAARIADFEEQHRQVEHNHARLETVLGAMLEGVVAVDADQRLLFANNAAIRLLDLKPAAMLGRPVWEAVRHADVQDLFRQAFDGDNPPQMEFELPQTHSTVAATASRLPGSPSPGVVLVLHDVTELRRLESLRREFVQNVSHELKTPLSSIAAYADTLLEGALDDPDCNRTFVQRIAEQADRLHMLILDLLALARMEAHEHAFNVEPTDVSRIVTASLDAHAGVAQAKQITLESFGPDEPVFGFADDEGLRTIIDNLLDNAVNYTPDGGRITVRWHRQEGRVQIAVEDTGVGIAREHQARIFQRFYRIDKARSRELGGTGLGLAIVKHLCQVLGGSISVHSTLGQGSTFTVELRAAAELTPV
jgi:two-component system, OmpR family, phosphate regulon sensor histidine kinase PhoR